MREILGKAKTVRELLKGVKYSIDYYQREYKWLEKQVRELVDDLSNKFLEEYRPDHDRIQVANYPHYFLGSIIISKKANIAYIVDGQQRLTSLTLLLTLLRNLQRDHASKVNVDDLIFSDRYGQKSFNLDVDERIPAMEALYDGGGFDITDRPESVQNLVRRYHDLETAFPHELRDAALPYFIDWLLENVHLVEITAYSDDDAYTIFETMNDRGLSLSPTDMLKGYLLANIDELRRTSVNEHWRDRVRALDDAGKEVASDFFKAWFRSQYAKKIGNARRALGPRTSIVSVPSTIAGSAIRHRLSGCVETTTTTNSLSMISISTVATTFVLSKQGRLLSPALNVCGTTPSMALHFSTCYCSRRSGPMTASR